MFNWLWLQKWVPKSLLICFTHCPVPPPKFFAYINPVQIHLDPLTLLWLNAFSLNLQQSVKSLTLEKTEPPYLDVKVEAIMFRVRMLSLFWSTMHSTLMFSQVTHSSKFPVTNVAPKLIFILQMHASHMADQVPPPVELYLAYLTA